MQAADTPSTSVRAREASPSLLLGSVAAATLTAAPLVDLAGLALDQVVLWAVGAHLATAGIVLALAAAVPGVLRHRRLPHASRERRRSFRRGLVTVLALCLFALARWVRGHPEVAPDPPIVAVECLAAGVIVVTTTLARRARRLPPPG